MAKILQELVQVQDLELYDENMASAEALDQVRDMTQLGMLDYNEYRPHEALNECGSLAIGQKKTEIHFWVYFGMLPLQSLISQGCLWRITDSNR